MSLLFTARYTRIQPNLQEASKFQVVDRKSKSNEFRPSSVSNEFHLGPVDGGDKADEGGDGDDDKFDAVVLAPTTKAKDAKTRDVLVPKATVNVKKSKRANTNTDRSALPDSVKSFQVDALDALRMYDSGATPPITDKSRKENKDAKPKDRKKKEKKKREKQEEEKEERHQRKKKKREKQEEENEERPQRKKKKRQKQEEEKEERPQRNKKAASNNRANAREKALPQVAWIMSFGGSVSKMQQVEEWAT
jgi:hypothetical protein